jgi:AcrR family transcriptional regulator
VTPKGLRRASYGSHSPVVGERGERTRRLILDVTRELIERKGLHGTLVDDIAAAADVSRTALYQYFASKEQIFAELLEECGSALMLVLDGLGPLGPTAEGLENLQAWLSEWASVYDRYAVMFAQWTQLEFSGTPLRAGVARFVEHYAGRIEDRLAASGVGGADRADTAVAVTLTVHRFHAYRGMSEVGRGGLSDGEALGSLAVIVQLMLFPDTPPDVLAAAPLAPPHSHHEVRGFVASTPVASLPVAPPPTFEDRFAERSRLVRATVRQVLDAAGRTFERYGFAGSSIDDIASEAGVTRGAVYRYFADKLDMLTILAREAHTELHAIVSRLPRATTPELLSAWLLEYVVVYRRHSGVVQVWTQGRCDDAFVLSTGQDLGAMVRGAAATLLAGVRRTYPVDLRVAVLVMAALLERLPHGLSVRSYEVTAEEIAETMVTVVMRGLLNPGDGSRESRAGEPAASHTDVSDRERWEQLDVQP